MAQRGQKREVELPTTAREALERGWFRRLQQKPALAAQVTGESLADEPFHRWSGYKQGFAPRLVRSFLKTLHLLDPPPDAPPLLDPFAGSGTFAVECARRGVPARGVEAIEALAFLASAKGARELPPAPSLGGTVTWQDIADRLTEPLHRAALMCAVVARHNSDGDPLRDPPPLHETLHEVVRRIEGDLRKPLALPVRVEVGDARDLRAIEDGSIGGILTSPPYLSRHDYTRATRPHEMVHAHWYPRVALDQRRDDQVRAHPKAHAQDWSRKLPPAVEEAVECLRLVDEPKLAGVTRSYFEDMTASLRACWRVLERGGPCWFVIGAARFKGVYIPSDTILAEIAQTIGFEVTRIFEARRLITSGRNLGTLRDVAPRESILVMRKP